jgi:hypothetical protein
MLAPMTDPDAQRPPSRRRFVVKELAILSAGLVVLFVVLGLVASLVLPLLGWSMCCQYSNPRTAVRSNRDLGTEHLAEMGTVG